MKRYISSVIYSDAHCFGDHFITLLHVGFTEDLVGQSIQSRVAIATQLANLERDLADSSLVLFASGVALTKTLNYLDGLGLPQTVEMTRLDRSGEVTETQASWTDCGCRNAV